MKLSLAAAAIAFSGTALMFAPAAASAAPVQGKMDATTKIGFGSAEFSKADPVGADFNKAAFDGAGFDKSAMAGKGGGMTAKLDTMDHAGMGGPLEEVAGKSDADTGGKFAGGDMTGKTGMDDDGKSHAASMDIGGKSWTDEGAMGGKLAMTGKAGVEGDEQLASKQVSDGDSSQPVETATVAKDPAASAPGKEAYAGMGGPLEDVADYPACSPGPGDDRCIQLYEVGASAKA